MKKVLIPLLAVFSAGWASANVNNIFDWSKISVDTQYTSSVIAPFTGACPPYNTCPPGPYWPEGFPVSNIFGANVQTAEGTPDTIFQDGGGYDNVFFHMNDLQKLNGNVHLTVTGAQDGPSNTYRSFAYFDLISYTFDNIADGNTYHYTDLYHGTPTTDSNGFESISANVNLSNAGPYFVYQFGTQNGGPRIFGVEATPEPGLYGLLGLGISGLALALKRRQKA